MISDQAEYELYLKALTDDQLRDEFAEVRRNYDLCRGEIAARKLVMRDRPSRTIRHLLGNQRMREAVAKYVKLDAKEEMAGEQRQDTE
jgi:hypothetical protein